MKHKIYVHLGLCTMAALTVLISSGCHSYHIDTTVENRTGATIQLLEVDYPSASFGADTLASGSDYHYSIQVRGSGQIKLSYTLATGKSIQIQGPKLVERQQGRLEIILQPNDKAQFIPQLIPPA